MVLSGALRVFLLCLLSLCVRRTEAQSVDPNSLARITTYLQQYSPGPNKQYAVGINIPAELCGGPFDPSVHFLPDDPNVVKCHFNKRELYQSDTMVGAVPKKNFHSEFWLLNPPNPAVSPMKNLLNRRKDGCVIFYSFNSPCLGTCLNSTNMARNVLTALDMFSEHSGPKAFVFSRIFGTADTEKYGEDFAKVDARIPLYRCDEVGCNACFDGGRFNANACLNIVTP